MAKAASPPLLIIPGQAARQLAQLPKFHAKFDEHFLQELLAGNPELLPAAAIRQDVGSLLCVGREVGVPSGSIDNLYISTSGYPVVVETKLWRNPQARREVLSQTLDYIKDIARMDFEWFEERWNSHRAASARPETSLLDRIREMAQDDIDERAFVDRVNHALMRGDILAMIVGDGIESRLQELVDHLCKDSAHLRYALALCELAFYALGPAESDGMLVVPRIVSNIEPLQRAYVRIDIAPDLVGKVLAIPEDVQETAPPRPANPVRVNLDEDALLRSVEAAVGPQTRKEFEAAYNDLIESFGLEADFGAAALMLKVPDPGDEMTGASLLAFEKQGRIYNPNLMPGRLERWGSIPPEDCRKLAEDYWAELHRIDSRFALDGTKHLSPNQFVPFIDLIPHWEKIRNAVGGVASKIRDRAKS